MQLKITSKLNLMFVLVALTFSIYSLLRGASSLAVLKSFAVMMGTWIWLINPYVSNKTIYLPGRSLVSDNSVLNKIARLVFFVLGLYGYFSSLNGMIAQMK